jgi:hypothetical protein
MRWYIERAMINAFKFELERLVIQDPRAAAHSVANLKRDI